MLKKLSLLALSIAVLAGCQETEMTVAAQALPVSTLQVAESVENQYRVFNGQVEAAENTPLAFRVEGELREVLVKAGQPVKKGQLLAVLDAYKFEQQRDDAKAQFELTTKQLKRGRELFTQKMISKAELDELTANQRLREVAYQSAVTRLSYTRLVAPFAGVVSDVDKESFETVSPGEPVISVYQDDKIYINMPVSDTVIAMINPSTKKKSYQPLARFGGDSRYYPVTYLKHTSEPEPQTQTYRVWFEMAQQTPAIMPGTSVALKVDMVKAGLSTLQGYQIPLIALQAGREEGQFLVWKVQDGEAHPKEVTVEQVTNQGAILSSGVELGDVLVTSSLRKLRDGMTISEIKHTEGAAQ
ncbi:efflux transporter periplasmic adaptor subunit [Photobacterium jeanii]|uniref:Efflux transporter periplasmic adaptor subunit n=1 Tax=Photobacterium jeanii TaxID=858640 RepID=A0A178K3U1_9GAMM|nr:efflux RND transporter periplasmic adaptor subunit [Photobacterium jeanii]OAN11424.1 efflux transporter periplasmic adaptor subunit [Photobacterium jeanii]PST90944.1 efflux RND transporter periplasmic adaptor subunit [Photobacterium jeanii]